MNSITIDPDELIGKTNKHQRYKQILNPQIREKNVDNSFRTRNHTTIDRSSPSFSFKNNQAIPGEKRLIQESNFLPSITDRSSRVRKGHERSFTHGYDDGDNNSFETDAIDYLRDCETILENLKRLTKNPTKKISNTKILDRIQNGQSIRNSLRIEKQPSFFRSPEIDSSLVLKPNGTLKKKRNDKDNEHSDHDENHREEDSQIKTISRISSGELKQDLTLKGKTDLDLLLYDNNENERKVTQEEKSIQTKITLKDDQNKTPSTTIALIEKVEKNKEIKDSDKTQEVDIKNPESIQNANDNCSNNSNFVPENPCGLTSEKLEVEKENTTIEKNGLSPEERKQKYLLKLLNKANTRGIELHKRIMEHKLKNRSSINCISNLCGKKKEIKDNIDKELEEKVEVLGKVDDFDRTKSTEREVDKIENGQTLKLEEQIFEHKTINKDQIESSKISKHSENEESEIKKTHPTIPATIGNNDRVGENKTYCENNQQNALNIFQKPSDDSEEEDSNEDEEEEEELENELLKGENNNNKTLNQQNELKQSEN